MTATPIKIFQADRWLAQILNENEKETLDFKRAGKVENVIKTICAMANTHGGLILLGVEDNRKAQGKDRIIGIDDKPECFGDIKREMLRKIIPQLGLPHCMKPTIIEIPCTLRDNSIGRVCLFQIHRSNAVHSLFEGETYARFDSQNRHLSATEITELSLRRGFQSAVDADVNVDLDLLKTGLWTEYATSRGLTRSFEEQLLTLGLAKKGKENKVRPTQAAVLLFAEHPGGLLKSKCAIRIFHYKGHQIDYTQDTNLARQPITVDGPILYQIRRATDTVLNELSSGVHVSRKGFEFNQSYPKRVIQEAITNAVIHRAYHLSRDIHIRIFTNRIEVESPGTFPGAVTVENLRKIGSRPRNRALVDNLREFPEPPNLDAGEGIRMMFATLEEDDLWPPIYREKNDGEGASVEVVLRNEARLSEWALVEDHLQEHDTISNADVRRIINTQSNTKASKLLKQWVSSGLIEVENPKAGTRIRKYKLPSQKDQYTLAIENLLSILEGNQLDLLSDPDTP